MEDVSVSFLIQAFQQLGAISAVLGGLAFAAAAALLSVAAGTRDPQALDRPAAWTAGASIASAACLIIAALTWALLTVQAAGAAASGQPGMVEAQLVALNRPASIAFITGVVLLFVGVGTSGWIASRMLGMITTTVALLAGVAALFIIFQFVN